MKAHIRQVARRTKNSKPDDKLFPTTEKPLKRCFSQEAGEKSSVCEFTSRDRLVFLLFCLLLRCHWRCLRERFSLARVTTMGPYSERPTLRI